ncbi:hypothetical protein KFK09_012065 [Dendrobium nobile]|uniref:Uncharacterized protein n=1 Tax=Dendrobium nobile TaxID=94219 RepID=A0A8T3BHS9_DENNO|nr:hypothetical protein KFK09_012065 [Dendrobium nobile]
MKSNRRRYLTFACSSLKKQEEEESLSFLWKNLTAAFFFFALGLNGEIIYSSSSHFFSLRECYSSEIYQVFLRFLTPKSYGREIHAVFLHFLAPNRYGCEIHAVCLRFLAPKTAVDLKARRGELERRNQESSSSFMRWRERAATHTLFLLPRSSHDS